MEVEVEVEAVAEEVEVEAGSEELEVEAGGGGGVRHVQRRLRWRQVQRRWR